MRALILADLHYVPFGLWQDFLKINQDSFDLILLLGDIEIHYLKDIALTFSSKTILGVHGNHDYPNDLPEYDINNLHGQTTKVNEWTFLGIEGCVRYKKGNRPMHSQDDICKLLESSPSVDVVLSHNSPKGIHDSDQRGHEGYIGLVEYVKTNKPKYVFHGHQHANAKTVLNNTSIIGVFGGVIVDLKTGDKKIVLELEDEK